MSAGERDISDVEIWGPCGHNWLDFACYAVGVLDDEVAARAIDVQAVACAACSDELGDYPEVARLIYEAVDIATASVWRPAPAAVSRAAVVAFGPPEPGRTTSGDTWSDWAPILRSSAPGGGGRRSIRRRLIWTS